MNKQSIPAVPNESRIEELLGKFQPLPSESFHQKIKHAAWRTASLQSPVKNANNHRVRLVLAMTVLFMIAGLLISPQGRAWAQQVFHFFTRINAQTVEIPESYSKLMEESANISYDLPLVPLFIPTVSPKMAALPGCETPEEAQSYRCRVALAESQVGFNLKELPATPENWKFESLYFNAASKQAMISYIVDKNSPASGSFLLTQGVGDFPTKFANVLWEAVPANKVEPVKVGKYDGEYVKGSFGTPADKTLVWSDSYVHRLAWRDKERWYGITLWPSPTASNLIGREQLIELAESLVDAPKLTTEALDPDALYSIADAEQISGLDLKAPAVLPLDIDFEYARYYSDDDDVRLFYGINNELVIYQRRANPDTRSTPSPTDKTVMINDALAIYGSSQDAHAHMYLRWQKDGMFYLLYYNQYFGRTIEKEELIAIAESMQDVNDFRKSGSRPYEYVSIYEQALGVDAKEFPAPPAQWSYDSVFGDALGQCIGLSYKPVTQPGLLLINQCGTDRYFDVSDIPADQLQQVQIRNIKGIYAAGDFATGDNGELVWDPDLPIKRLYWQENGLWMDMKMYGAATSRHDKEDLISYAESLR
jgi:hypothetical protein